MPEEWQPRGVGLFRRCLSPAPSGGGGRLSPVPRGPSGMAAPWFLPAPLSPAQLKRLEQHRYSSAGRSLLEPWLQPYWGWLVERLPPWLAPNAITLGGLLLNCLTALPLIASCPTATEQVPPCGTRPHPIPAGTECPEGRACVRGGHGGFAPKLGRCAGCTYKFPSTGSSW